MQPMNRWTNAPNVGAPANLERFILLAAIVFLAFILRLYCLDCQSLWLDEAASAYWTAVPLPHLFLDTADNLHVPGYFLLLRGWVALGGMSPFSLRYFSLLSGLLLIPTAFWFARHFLHSRRSASLAALLAAFSPAHIYFSQETRMYAVLPVLFLFMLALVLNLWREPRRTRWALLAALELFALYLHLFSGLMLLAINLLLGLAFWQRHRTLPFLTAWLGSQLLVVLALAPWLWFTWHSGGALPANLGDTSGGMATFRLGSYLAQVWIFLATGLTALRPFLHDWSTLLALILACTLLLVLSLGATRERRALLALLTAIALPLLAGALVWLYNPLTHPRYLFFLIAPLTILTAYALAQLFKRRTLAPFAAATLFLILILDVTAVRATHIDAAQRRYDAAALAAAIADRGGPQDVVLMPPYDRSLWYYDPAPVRAANWPFAAGRQDERPALLQALLKDYRSVFLVEYHDLYSYDLHRQLPFLLEANGYLLERFTVDRMDVSHYALSGWATPQLAPVDYRCGPLRLTAAHFPAQVEPGDAPAIALRWRLEEATSQSFIASARLMDGDEQLSSADHPLLDQRGARTASWSPDAEVTTYFVLPLPLGTPSLTYTLNVLLYAPGDDPLRCGPDDSAIHLGHVALARADQRSADAYGSWSDALWQTPESPFVAPGLALEGYSVRPLSIRPEEPVYVTLRWRASADLHQEIHPVLLLMENESLLDRATGDLFQRFPTTRWREGDLLVETVELNMYPTLRPLTLALAEKGKVLLPLGEVRIDASALQWSVPKDARPLCANFQGIGTLRGVHWPETGSGAAQRLTLYWQADAGAPSTTSYTVFAQLLAADGRLLTQDDGPPFRGERPTNSWLPGEVIADERRFDLPPEEVGNQATLSVGFYELESLQRVPAFGCAGRRLADDAFTIVAPQISR